MMTGWRVAVGEDTTSAIYEPAESGADVALFVCAHGAGGNMMDRGMNATAAAMRANGLGVVRFNFLYKEKKSGRPDPMPRLIETTRAVIAHALRELAPRRLVIGGRSMGGRAASMLAAEDGENGAPAGTREANGLLLLAYPLHPAGQPAKLRDAHLASIRMPVLCFNGTRDALCTQELMERALAQREAVLPTSSFQHPAPWTMEWIDSADHMFHVLKSSGTTDAAVMAQIGRTAGAWAAKL